MVSLQKNTVVIGVAGVIILTASVLLFNVLRNKTPDWVTATVERGEVTQIVSVSGFVEAENTAELSFPATGIVTEVYAHEGMEVKGGEVLATLGSAELIAKRSEALAQIAEAEASYDKLLAGAKIEDRTIAQTSLQNAEQALERVQKEQDEKVATARRALLSNDLEAQSDDATERATAPTVTGTYTCQDEGVYTVTVYNSNAYSGYSYRYSGLEEGTGSVATEQPGPLGECGLYLQFAQDDTYGNSTWTIEVPNKRSATYLTYANAYALALQARANAVAEAEDDRMLASAQTQEVLAGPQAEEIRIAQASLNKAYAALGQVDALLRDRSVTAPFDGVITDVDIVKGEAATNDPVITMLASDAFKLTARIPEIDITKLQPGQKVTAVFDAAPMEIQHGKVSYISPLATIIDGVAYFEATIALEEKPGWLRSGLNADVDIIVGEKEDALRLSRRFIIENNDGTWSVQVPKGSTYATTTVKVDFAGNDGFVEVIGLNEGDTVIAP